MNIKRIAAALADRILPQTQAAAGCAFERWFQRYRDSCRYATSCHS